MTNRCRTDIIAHILEAANGGMTKTKLVYEAFLNYPQVQEYLKFLIEKGLLAHDETSRTYKTAPKGHQCRQTLDKLNEVSGLAVETAFEIKRSDLRKTTKRTA